MAKSNFSSRFSRVSRRRSQQGGSKTLSISLSEGKGANKECDANICEWEDEESKSDVKSLDEKILATGRVK